MFTPRLLLLPLALFACDSGSGTADPWADEAFQERAHVAVEGYVHLVMDSYDAAIASAEAMDAAIDAFVAAPSADTMAAAKQAWLAARDVYGQTEVYRFYDGPIDVEPGGLEGQINAWPMDEAYMDYVADDETVGIINNLVDYPTIDRQLLIDLNTADGEDSISTGWHAVEFLLWGQDLSVDGPGARPWADYVTGADATAANGERRGQYLTIVTDLLLEDLKAVRSAWDKGAPYHEEFEQADAQATIKKILTGMGSLSGAELSGERMKVAYDTRDQEDEHSCFSDNTHRDFISNALGIENAYLNRWDAEEEGSIAALVAELDPDLDAKFREQLRLTNEAMNNIPVPFDAAIQAADGSPEREAVSAAITALRTQTETIVEIATLLDISLDLE